MEAALELEVFWICSSLDNFASARLFLEQIFVRVPDTYTSNSRAAFSFIQPLSKLLQM
jgi:hypothetical protein